jgi:predicted acylesterase/phospholipase RssA
MARRRLLLAFSGGGFRAALFHLGGVRCLWEAKRLADVDAIVGVSGGSLLVAHLGAYWRDYAEYNSEKFARHAQGFADVTYDGLRFQLLRGALWRRTWGRLTQRASDKGSLRTEVLAGLIRRRITGRRTQLERLDCPQFYFLATDIRDGTAVVLSDRELITKMRDAPRNCREEYRFSHDRPSEDNAFVLPTADWSAAYSTSFPGLFDANRVSGVAGGNAGPLGGCLLVDGGVFDNTGASVFRNIDAHARSRRAAETDGNAKYWPWTERESDLVVSDAGRPPGSYDTDNASFGAVRAAFRAALLFEARVGDLIRRSVRSPNRTRGRIRTSFASISAATQDGLPGSLAELLPWIRTDLDSFPRDVGCALFVQGYCAMRQALRSTDGADPNSPQAPGWTPSLVAVRRRRKGARRLDAARPDSVLELSLLKRHSVDALARSLERAQARRILLSPGSASQLAAMVCCVLILLSVAAFPVAAWIGVSTVLRDKRESWTIEFGRGLPRELLGRSTGSSTDFIDRLEKLGGFAILAGENEPREVDLVAESGSGMLPNILNSIGALENAANDPNDTRQWVVTNVTPDSLVALLGAAGPASLRDDSRHLLDSFEANFPKLQKGQESFRVLKRAAEDRAAVIRLFAAFRKNRVDLSGREFQIHSRALHGYIFLCQLAGCTATVYKDADAPGSAPYSNSLDLECIRHSESTDEQPPRVRADWPLAEGLAKRLGSDGWTVRLATQPDGSPRAILVVTEARPTIRLIGARESDSVGTPLEGVLIRRTR